MTANIETLLDWMRQRIEHKLGSGEEFTHEHLITLLSHIDKLESELKQWKASYTELYPNYKPVIEISHAN